MRREYFWHDLCDRYIERPKEVLNPKLMKEEKFFTDSSRLYRVTNFYGKRWKHRWASSMMKSATLGETTSSA